jgi:hypothetical protein
MPDPKPVVVTSLLRRKITITPVSPPGDSIAFGLGDGISTPTTTSNWEVTNRPKRKGLTDWVGQDPYRLPVAILIDGFLDDRSVEAEIEVLRRLERAPQYVDGDRRPAVCTIAGPLPLTQLRWVIEQVEWGNEIRSERTGVRVRQAATIHFLEFTDVDLVMQDSPAKRAQRRAAAEADAVPGIGQIVGRIGLG